MTQLRSGVAWASIKNMLMVVTKEGRNMAPGKELLYDKITCFFFMSSEK